MTDKTNTNKVYTAKDKADQRKAEHSDNKAGTITPVNSSDKKTVTKEVATISKRATAYITGTFALLVVAASAIAALLYAATHHTETLNNLASSTLSGIGIAIGGCIGSALILRFKSARQYIRAVLKDLQ